MNTLGVSTFVAGTIALLLVANLVTHAEAVLEECPLSCSPVNDAYGPACASVDNASSYKTYPNLCLLFKERCHNRKHGGPVIEFFQDGACSSSNPREGQVPVLA